MPSSQGRILPLSPARRLIGDLLSFGRRIPLVPFERTMRLADVAAARQAAQPRPGWCAVFTKAYAVVAAARPELRRAYLSFPRPRLYEHPNNLATVAIERRLGDEDAVLFTHIRAPENHPLPLLDAYLRRCKEAPVDQISLFRRALRVSRLPQAVRRLLWWLHLNVSGPRRARLFGTFGVSVTAGDGASALQLISPLTTTLHYGLVRPDGSVDVRLTFDHRVLDGGPIARALAHLEEVLHGPILEELRSLDADREGPNEAWREEWQVRATDVLSGDHGRL